MSNNKLNKDGVKAFWDRVFVLIKKITGDVDVKDKGTLQEQVNGVSTRVEECFTYVSNGKKAVANAITGKGISTAEDAEFATMAENIGKIKSTPKLQSKSTTLDTGNTSVTMKPDTGYDGLDQATAKIVLQEKSVTLGTSAQSITPDSGKLLSKVTVPAVPGNAALTHVLTGKTFSSATSGVGKAGTMENKAGTTVKASAISQDDDNTYLTIPAAGYYDEKSKVYTENSNLGNINLAKFIGVSVYVGSGGDGLYKYTYDVEKCGKIKLEKSSFPDCALAWAHGKNDNSLTSVTFYKADGITKISDLAMTVDETYSVPSEAKYAVLASSRWGGSSARNSYTYIQSV